MQVRGGIQSCPRHGSDTFAFKFSAFIKFDGENKPFEYYVKVKTKPHPKITEEKLAFINCPMIFQSLSQTTNSTSGNIKIQYNNFARGSHKPVIEISNDRSALSRYSEFASKNINKLDQCVSVVEGIKRYLRSSFIFDPNPKLMRKYERIGNNVLLKDGSNLSAVLYDLSIPKVGLSQVGLRRPRKENAQKQMSLNESIKVDDRTYKKDSISKILNWIRQVPQEPYLDIEFVTTKLNDVTFGFKEPSNNFLADAKLLSDGTLRSLAVLTALETVADDSRVVIEEFDNGLHPSRVNILTDAIMSCCKSKNLNVLVTTHNPASLNALEPEQMKAVVMCIWDSRLDSFNLITLSELPRFEQLLEKGNLGDLVTKDILKSHLKPQFEEEYKKKSLEWLENL